MVRNRYPAIQPVLAKSVITILLVEDSLAEARMLQEILKGTVLNRFQVVHVKRLAEAIATLNGDRSRSDPTGAAIADPPQPQHFDVILLDLTLPDSTGLHSLERLIAAVPTLPIVVLTNTNDNELAIAAVRRGAQDYLMKRQVTQDLLVRSLRYAIERKHAAEALREANEILEQRVVERTAELAAANALLRTEINARQQAQKRLTLAQQVSKIGTFEWNIQDQEMTWSAELEILYDRQPGELGHTLEPWLQAVHPEDRDRVEAQVGEAIAQGQGFSDEFRILTPNQNCRWIGVNSSLFNDAAGQPLRMIGIHMDITEKKQLERQFLRAQRLESLGTLASGIAHDLNNILTPVLGVVQLLPLQFPDLSDRTRLLLDTLDSSARRGADLVKQILSFSRGVEGKRMSLNLTHLLKEIQDLVRQTLPKTIEIQSSIDPDPWPILGDATQLHQIFMNLCVNARDAMPDGGQLIIAAQNQMVDRAMLERNSVMPASVMATAPNMAPVSMVASATRSPSNPMPHVIVTITDTGTGIPPDVIDRIFDPFFTTKPLGKGTGLGLSAVIGIVKSHGGWVDVQSQVGQGSTFTVGLPATPQGQEEVEPIQPLRHGQQELILVVDDEVSILEVARLMLESHHYRVMTANSGKEAIALFHQHQDAIACVVMDMMLPEMDGPAILKAMLAQRPNLPCLAMSGLHSKQTVAIALKQGFGHFIPKPFTQNDFLSAVQQTIPERL
ncbi:MAG: response regulator [Leptolyngbyaceae cyanobacterium]